MQLTHGVHHSQGLPVAGSCQCWPAQTQVSSAAACGHWRQVAWMANAGQSSKAATPWLCGKPLHDRSCAIQKGTHSPQGEQQAPCTPCDDWRRLGPVTAFSLGRRQAHRDVGPGGVGDDAAALLLLVGALVQCRDGDAHRDICRSGVRGEAGRRQDHWEALAIPVPHAEVQREPVCVPER